MTNYKIELTENGTFVVLCDSERFGKQAIVYESFDQQECRNYVRRMLVSWYVHTGNREYLADLLNWLSFEKTKQLIMACERNEYLTSVYGMEHCYVFLNKDGGLYIKMTGTRSTWTCYIAPDGQIKRATKLAEMHEIDNFQACEVIH